MSTNDAQPKKKSGPVPMIVGIALGLVAALVVGTVFF